MSLILVISILSALGAVALLGLMAAFVALHRPEPTLRSMQLMESAPAQDEQRRRPRRGSRRDYSALL
jgi:hypothetical protein